MIQHRNMIKLDEVPYSTEKELKVKLKCLQNTQTEKLKKHWINTADPQARVSDRCG